MRERGAGAAQLRCRSAVRSGQMPPHHGHAQDLHRAKGPIFAPLFSFFSNKLNFALSSFTVSLLVSAESFSWVLVKEH